MIKIRTQASVETTPSRAHRPAPEAKARTAVLDGRTTEGRKEWLEMWNAWPERDIMAHADYVRLFARPEDRVLAAILRSPGGGGVLYPVILRPLALEPWAPPGIQGCDLTTPYGYGGPFTWNTGPEDAARFWAFFEDWAAGEGAVSSFARLSLFPEQVLPFHGQRVVAGPNIIRRLHLSDELLWADYHRQARKSIELARRNNVTIEFDEKGERLDEFLDVYVATMDRRKASSGYYFPRTFFENLLQGLRGHSLLVHALAGGKVVSTEILLLGRHHVYSYLGGTRAEAFPMSPNYLLKHETFRWCRERGFQTVILGGGYQPNDGILRYKQTFTNDPPGAFHLGRKTFNPELSVRLTEDRRRWEQAQGREWTPLPEFFPDYRS